MNEVKVTVEGSKLKAKLKSLENKFGAGQPVVVVGYTQYYAIYVHEIQAKHPVGQWKYLETPARQLAAVLANLVASLVAKGKTLEQALLIAGLRLQRDSQLIVPVDTSALKASAFTSTEANLEAASEAAFIRSEAIRKGKKP